MPKSVEYYYTHKIVRETLLAACIDPNLTNSAKAVLACLFAHANTKYPSDISEDGYLVDENGKRIGCFPSQETIASEAQISENAVSLAVKLLRKEGYVMVKTSKLGNGYRQNNEYLLELTKGKSPHQIRTEGKARLALVREGNGSPSADGASKPTRVGLDEGLSSPTRVGVSSPTRVGVSSPTRVGSNVDKPNVDKSNIDASLAHSPTSLDTSIYVSSSPDNEIDLSPDTSIDVPSSPKTLSSAEKCFEANGPRSDQSDVTSSPETHWDRVLRKQRMYDEEREVSLLTDEDLGVTSSPDGEWDVYVAERTAKVKMRQAQVRRKYASL